MSVFWLHKNIPNYYWLVKNDKRIKEFRAHDTIILRRDHFDRAWPIDQGSSNRVQNELNIRRRGAAILLDRERVDT